MTTQSTFNSLFHQQFARQHRRNKKAFFNFLVRLETTLLRLLAYYSALIVLGVLTNMMGPPGKPKSEQPSGSNSNTGRTPSLPSSPPTRPTASFGQSDREAYARTSPFDQQMMPPNERRYSRRAPAPVISTPQLPPAPPPSPAPQSTPQQSAAPAWLSPVFASSSPSSRPAVSFSSQPSSSSSTSTSSRSKPPSDMPASTAEAHVHRLSMLNKLLDKNVALTSAEARDRLRLTYMLEKNNLSPINIEEDNLFLGRYRATLDPLLLSTFGITHIVNCGRGYPRDEVTHARFGYLHIKANDTTEERLGPYFPQACEFIEQALKSGGKVLIHCAAGISRSSTILLAYLMRSRRWPLLQAFDFVKDKRTIIRPNPAFAAELLDWEELVLGVRVTKPSIARNVQAVPAKQMDWRQAMSVMFAESRKGVPICRDTGMAHLVWDEFKKAFPTDGSAYVPKILYAILAEAHAQIRSPAAKETQAMQAILVMGSKYVPHVLASEFLTAVREALPASTDILTCFGDETLGEAKAAYVTSFMDALEDTAEKWLDQRMFTVYNAESPDWNRKKVEVWELTPVLGPASIRDEQESKKRKLGAAERVEMFLLLLSAQEHKENEVGGRKRRKTGEGQSRFVLEVVQRPRKGDEEKRDEALTDGTAPTPECAVEDEEMVEKDMVAVEPRAEDEVMGDQG